MRRVRFNDFLALTIYSGLTSTNTEVLRPVGRMLRHDLHAIRKQEGGIERQRDAARHPNAVAVIRSSSLLEFWDGFALLPGDGAQQVGKYFHSSHHPDTSRGGRKRGHMMRDFGIHIPYHIAIG